MIWAALPLAALTAAPFLPELFREPVTGRPVPEDIQFADLPKGRIAYRWQGDEADPVVVCVHGLTTPGLVWEGLAPHLVGAGFRVLTLDLYGRGNSDRPRGKQDAAFFNAMLSELFDHLHLTAPVTLIGNSMGSAISANFAAARPDRVRQVVLLVPAGLGHDLGRAADLARRFPVLGQWMIHAFYPGTLRKGVAAERALSSSVTGIYDRQLEELRYRGFLRSVQNSLSGILGTALEEAHRKLHDAEIPVVAVWGAEDDIIPLSCKDRLAMWNPEATQIVMDGCGHGLVYTHTDALWQRLGPALKR
ncbi:alpha/beta hydrolase [Shimia sp. SDUM112013]|uniref:alpha/beta fold hydrolase n=1 Tax=Shimia sp. SDUM112013 TaxID=3136160 RepID=UPI0032EB8425